jgi:hypothetical protein
MCRVNAIAVVAVMADDQTLWNWSVGKRPRYCISIRPYSVTPRAVRPVASEAEMETAASVTVRRTEPRPTGIRCADGDS